MSSDRRPFRLLVGGLFLFSLSTASAAEVPFFKVFDPARRDGGQWSLEDPAVKLDLFSFEGVATVRPKSANRSWGSLYRTVAVDLDEHPLLQINVLDAQGRWYLILSGSQVPNGYIRLTETEEPGFFSFDIPALTRLSGRHTFEVKIGLINATGGALREESISFDKLLFVTRGADAAGRRKAAAPSRPAKAAGDLDAFDPAGGDLDLWEESAPDGPQETRFQVKNGVALVKGRIDRNYGAVYRRVTLNVDDYKFLEIRVLDRSQSWYIILSSPALPQGYARLLESDKAGHLRVPLPKPAGFSGVQTFYVQIGISHPAGSSIRGQSLVFDLLRFKKG